MTTQEIILLAKEKLGKDISEQEAQDYLDGKSTLPDEALEVVSGGRLCIGMCPKCSSRSMDFEEGDMVHCLNCGYRGSIYED